MSIAQTISINSLSASEIGGRVRDLSSNYVAQELDAQGSAVLEHLLSAQECRELAALYPQDELFRSRVVMSRHGFGRGEYKYFKYPLPELIADLRTEIYPRLAPIANRWNEAMGIGVRFPEKHEDFIERCHKTGQTKPTPLLLHTKRGITTVFTRIFTESTSSRCRWRFFFRSLDGISKAASL